MRRVVPDRLREDNALYCPVQARHRQSSKTFGQGGFILKVLIHFGNTGMYPEVIVNPEVILGLAISDMQTSSFAPIDEGLTQRLTDSDDTGLSGSDRR